MAGSVGRRLAPAGVLSAEPRGRAMPQAVPDEGVAAQRRAVCGILYGVSPLKQRDRGRGEVPHQEPLQ